MREGLRTLVFGRKKMSEEQWAAFNAKYEEVSERQREGLRLLVFGGKKVRRSTKREVREGLRALVFGRKKMSEEQWTAFNAKYEEVSERGTSHTGFRAKENEAKCSGEVRRGTLDDFAPLNLMLLFPLCIVSLFLPSSSVSLYLSFYLSIYLLSLRRLKRTTMKPN